MRVSAHNKKNTMNNFKIFLISIICCLSGLYSNAQTSTIVIKAQASDGQKIKLRWVIVGDSASKNSNVNDNLTEVWQRYLKYGFVIERRQLGSNVIEREMTVKADEAKLTAGIINLSTQEERDACSIMKNSIFGAKSTLYKQVGDVSYEKEIFQRYFYTTTSSAVSFKASCYAGLGVIDDQVLAGTTYSYTIKEANPPVTGSSLYMATVEIINTQATVSTNSLSDKSAKISSARKTTVYIEEPPLPIAKFRNKKVELKWRWRKPDAINSHQDLYYGYYIERASEPDLTNFQRLNNVPFVSGGTDSDTLHYIDQDTTKANSILKNGKKYSYRLVGRTYFDDGNEGITSKKIVTGKCKDDSPYYPVITKDSLTSDKQVYFKWTIPKETPQYHFKKYAIAKSESVDKGALFSRVPLVGGISADSTVDSTQHSAIVTMHSTSAANTTQAAYYTVVCITEDGSEYSSLPVLVQGIDSLPPAIPVNVQAVWNATAKTATITWNPNTTDSDLLGYKIYRSLPGGLPIAISDTAINKRTTYIDTVKVANLKVLYYVSAIDKMYNPSKLSAPGILRIPDNDPPIKPTFGNFKINSQGQVELNIYPSPSTDVALHELRRSIDTQILSLKNWTTPEKPSSYTDTGLTSGGKVSYIIEAIDSTGNKSSDTLEVDIPSILIAKPQFTLLNSSASRIDPSIKLNWDYTIVSASNEVREFVLLKCDVSVDATGKLGTWKTVSGDTREISDFDVYYERTYKYGVKAIFKDGSSSTWLYTTLTMPTVCGAAKYLEEQGKLFAGDNVLKEACESIRLLPGFHAPKNSVFHAVIKKK
jgi:uncharacterized protein